jgi:hypothetical protein
MAFRIEKTIGAILIFGLTAVAQAKTFQVRHQHWRKGRPGTLVVAENAISFGEYEKKLDHSRQWKYEDIQQLTLTPAGLRILTYEDQKWRFNRDREYVFDQLPADFAVEVYPLLRDRLEGRFVAEIADPDVTVVWKALAKLHQGLGGAEGAILFGDDRVVFEAGKDHSHTWRYGDIDNISSSGPFDLSIMTRERSAWYRGTPTEYHFQLKEAMSEDRYNDLWRRLNRNKGLQILSP